MTKTKRQQSPSLLVTTSKVADSAPEQERPEPDRVEPDSRGFGGGAGRSPKRKGGKKRNPSLSKDDWGPLGKHPDLEAILARQRLRLPLSGRLEAGAVSRAWKSAAAEHHPDRGGQHDTMQLVNAARDLLLGRGIDGLSGS